MTPCRYGGHQIIDEAYQLDQRRADQKKLRLVARLKLKPLGGLSGALGAANLGMDSFKQARGQILASK